MTEYETQFTALSRFAVELVSDTKLKCRKFESGLIPAIAEMVVVHTYTDYMKLVDGALRAEKQLAKTKKIIGTRTGSIGGAPQTQSQSQSSQQSSRKTRDGPGSSGGTQSSRAPWSSVTVPSQGSGTRRDVTCYTCGR